MKILLAGMLLVASSTSYGCDACGIYLGIQPHDRTSNFGLLYRYRLLEGDLSYTTMASGHIHGGHELLTTGSSHVREIYQTVELRAHFWLTPRLSVLASMPLVNNYQSANGYMRADLYGMGDPYVLLRSIIAQTRPSDREGRLLQRLSMGAGVKFPLGHDDLPATHGGTAEHDLQPGSGSWDALGTLEYMVRLGTIGASLSTVARLNGANAEGHQMGHGLMGALEVFHTVDIGAIQWMPSLGTYLEATAQDQMNGEPIDGTGTTTLFAHVGSRVWWKAWSLMLHYQFPIAHNIGALMLPEQGRAMVGITYQLTKNNTTSQP